MDWRDEALAASMAELTGITDWEIRLSDVWELTEIRFESDTHVISDISDISPLASLTNLKNLYLFYNYICDFSPVESVPNLIGREMQLQSSGQ